MYFLRAARVAGPACRNGDPMRFSPALVAILLIGATIAAITPFDVAFDAATFGSPAGRVGLISVLALIGAGCADGVGLRLEAHGARRPVLVGIAAAVAVAAYIVAIDGVLFRAALPASYVGFFETMGLRDRLVYFMLRAFNENVIYRLFAFSTLFWLISRLKGVPAGELSRVAVWCAIVAAQVLNIGMNVAAMSPDPFTFATAFYDAIRYVAPGVLWGWLYWRLGF